MIIENITKDESGGIHALTLVLPNGNRLRISLPEENTINIRNTTIDRYDPSQMGLLLETDEYGSINLIPEG